MSIHIRSEDEMREEARAYTLERETVTGMKMAEHLKIGWKFADAFIREFEAEGLISHADKSYRHNVRSRSGELTQPTSKPPIIWEDVINRMFTWIVRLRGRDGPDAASRTSTEHRLNNQPLPAEMDKTMTDTDHLEIGTISFARCEGVMVVPSSERVRLILAAAKAYEPDILVTAGHAIDTIEHLLALAERHRELNSTTAIVTEVLHDGVEEDLEPHAMWLVTAEGGIHRFGQQVFGRREEVNNLDRDSIARFERALSHRAYALPEWNIFALICGELNVVRGRDNPVVLSDAAEAAIMAADIIINPTHDRMGNAGTLDAKRRLLSRTSEDNRNRVYVSCSNWEACGDERSGRIQHVTPTLHTVYAMSQPCEGEQLADGSFGFCYRRWILDL